MRFLHFCLPFSVHIGALSDVNCKTTILMLLFYRKCSTMRPWVKKWPMVCTLGNIGRLLLSVPQGALGKKKETDSGDCGSGLATDRRGWAVQQRQWAINRRRLAVTRRRLVRHNQRGVGGSRGGKTEKNILLKDLPALHTTECPNDSLSYSSLCRSGIRCDREDICRAL